MVELFRPLPPPKTVRTHKNGAYCPNNIPVYRPYVREQSKVSTQVINGIESMKIPRQAYSEEFKLNYLLFWTLRMRLSNTYSPLQKKV